MTGAPYADDLLEELIRARNGYLSAVASARGFVSGKRIYALREEERRYKAALWAARDRIDQWARSAAREVQP